MGSPFWGTGLFVQGAEAVLDFAFRGIGLEAARRARGVDNGRGNAALQKLGAVCEGIIPDGLVRNGTSPRPVLLDAVSRRPAPPQDHLGKGGPLISPPCHPPALSAGRVQRVLRREPCENSPGRARLFVGATICGGSSSSRRTCRRACPSPACLLRLPSPRQWRRALKLRLPLGTTGSSNLSVSYTIDFAVAAPARRQPRRCWWRRSARWTQSTFRTARRESAVPDRSSTSRRSSSRSRQRGLVFTALGGQVGVFDARPASSRSSAAALATTCSTPASMATRRRPLHRPAGLAVWHSNFLWTAPSYFVGAGAAAAAAARLGGRLGLAAFRSRPRPST